MDATLDKFYIVIAGKLELRNSNFSYEDGKTIGTVSVGDTLGEEGIYELSST
jgi:hypothetical protein